MSIGSGLAFLSVAVALGVVCFFLSPPWSFIAAVVVGPAGFKLVADAIKGTEKRRLY